MSDSLPKEKKSTSAYPLSEQASNGYVLRNHLGLTRRELFAAMALQGMLSSDMSTDRTKANKPKWAKAAVEFADALLKELKR